ncbi:hypothetical protein SAY86_024920 [Trapa natans]|uniref:J domain-containing protein n=1 Tax=Trapa natans TaxID=22666 RepID=A0AAN7MQ82_TRANT|nr:hypothetical protein SAY86_024920 [Trapa natans]
MAFLAALLTRSGVRPLNRHSRILSHRCPFLFHPSRFRVQRLDLSTAASGTEFGGGNAYELLGVSETSSFAEIKASFRKLAKETHPDLAEPKDSGASQRFIQILAAYEILSDANRRAHYDKYLTTQKKFVQKISREGSVGYSYRSFTTGYRQMEVVEWLRWYRYAINDIVSEKKVVTGTGYFDVLEGDFYSAIHAAYYGPEIESLDFLPDCFEAEERSVYDNPEVLHLVCGRDLFGMVCIVNDTPQLSSTRPGKLTAPKSYGLEVCQDRKNAGIYMSIDVPADDTATMPRYSINDSTSDAYRDLELYISGRLVAAATRVPPQSSRDGTRNDGTDDQIHVFLSSCDISTDISQGWSPSISSTNRSSTLVSTINGLGTSPEEGSCFVYDNSGAKTHVLVKHRTFLVKHLHWYRLGSDVSICECRSTRARLPPSKFWLFEPRCASHDIGGWYVETYGRDKKNMTALSRRFWDGFDASEQFDQRLHPAIYLLALAYRTLDIEASRRRKAAVSNVVEGLLSRVLNWCKKVV